METKNKMELFFSSPLIYGYLFAATCLGHGRLLELLVSRGAGPRHVRDGLCEDVPVCKARRWDASWRHQARGPGQPAQGHNFVCPLSPPLVPSPPMKHGQKSEALPGKEGVSSKSTAGFWCEELCPRNMVMTVVGCTAGGRAACHLSGTGADVVWAGCAAACFQTLLRCQEEGL